MHNRILHGLAKGTLERIGAQVCQILTTHCIIKTYVEYFVRDYLGLKIKLSVGQIQTG